MTRLRSGLAALFGLLILGISGPLWAPPAATVQVGGTTLVSRSFYGRTDIDMVYRIAAVNHAGASVSNLTASVTSASPNTKILEGGLSYPNHEIADGETVDSLDTITIRQKRSVPFVLSAIAVQFSYDLVPSNQPPTAHAGADQTLPVGATAALDGNASSDPEGDPLTFLWSLAQQPAQSAAAVSNATIYNPTLFIDKPGSYRLSLIVNDGEFDSAPAQVLIDTVNSAPVADAGDPVSAFVNDTVQLDAGQSYDIDGDALTFDWTLTQRPPLSTAQLSKADTADPTVTLDRAGNYTAELVVNDGFLDSAPDQVVISTDNSRPIADAGADQAATLGETVTLDGIASYDPDLGPLSYAWSLTTQPVGSVAAIVNAGQPLASLKPDTVGDYIAQLIVSDGTLDSVADTTIVTVTAGVPTNQPPVVSAGADQTVTLPAAAMLYGTATDDGKPNPPAHLTTTWSLVSGPSASVVFGNPSTLDTSATFTAPGVYRLRLTASDGALSQSSDTQVTVSDGPPVFLAIPDRTIALGTRYQQLLVASDANVGDTLIYALPTAPTGAALSPSPLVDWTPTAAQLGTNTFTATVADTVGNTATTTFKVTVEHTNQAPQLVPQPNVILPVGTAFSRTLQATDPDADDTLTFALVSGPAGMTLTGNALHWPTTGIAPGDAPVTVSVTDAGGLTDSKPFTVTLTPAAPGPVALDDSYTAKVNQILSVPAAGVLTNDVYEGIGTLSAARLTDPGVGTLTAFNSDGGFAYQAPATVPGDPLTVTKLWSVGLSSDRYHELVADLNADGYPDIISFDNNAGIRAWSGLNGGQLWSADRTDRTDCSFNTGRGSMDSRVLADIDDSGYPSLAQTTACLRTDPGFANSIIAFDHLGKLKWVSPPLAKPHPDNSRGAATVPPGGLPPGGVAEGRGLSVARLTADGPPVLLMRADISVNDGSTTYHDTASKPHYAGCRAVTGLPADENIACRATFIISGTDGSVLQTLLVRNPAANSSRPGGPNALWEMPPIAMDIEGDGRVDLVSGTEVWMQNASGGFDLAWQLPRAVNDTAVADLDGDGKAEIIHLRSSGEPTKDNRGIFIYSNDGQLKRRIPLETYWFTPLTIADVDGDGRSDIVLGADGTVYAFRDDGRPIWAYVVPADVPDNPVFAPFYTPPTQNVWVSNAAPQVYDLDGDGVAEVVVAGESRIMVLNGRTGLRKLDPYWTYNRSYNDISALMLLDMNNDGHVDIVQNAPFQFNCSYAGAGFATECARLLGPTALSGGGSNNWLPGPKAFPHVQYRSTAIDGNAQVLHDTKVSRIFRTPEQQGTVRDPRLAQATSFTYAASDGTATTAPATVIIDIVPDNRPPVFTSMPPTSLLERIGTDGWPAPNFYAVAAYDPDPGDTLTFSLKTAPSYVSINSADGLIRFESSCASGRPTFCNWGWTKVIVTATDSRGASTDQIFIVNLTSTAVAVPNVVGMSLDTAQTALIAVPLQGVKWVESFSALPLGTVLAQDAVAGAVVGRFDDIRLTVSKGPQPFTMPFVVGDQLAPTNALLTSAGLTVNVTSTSSTTIPVGEIMAQAPAAGTELLPGSAPPVALTVSAGGPLPLPIASIVLEPGPGPLLRLAGDEVQYRAVAILTDGTSADVSLSAAWSSSATSTATISPTGVAKAIRDGATTLSATLDGKSVQGTLNVAARALGDNTPPTANITSPADGATVIGPIPILGTASDTDFLRYELAVASAGGEDWRLIGEGSASVTNGTLGALDPTLLLNGIYTLRLTVFDRGSNIVTAEIPVLVEGNQKVGYFTLSYTDLVVPLSGIPIQVTRTYDSRDAQKGDFGVGWSMGLKAIKVSTTRELGTGWQVDKGGLNYNLAPGSEHFVSVTLPSGRVESFDVRISPNVSPLVPFQTATASFVARPGALGTLRAMENVDLLIIGAQPGPVTLVDDVSLNTFNPDRFIYTQRDGTEFIVRRSSGVESVKDTNGNQITITPGGITHSAGTSIVFTRDAESRITSITDPKGMSRIYSYSGAGDLATTTDRLSNTTSYFYNRSHGLIRIIDPLGQSATRADYDAQGRLIAITDANGQVTRYQHDLPGRQELVEDPLGRITVYNYDPRGNVLSRTDPLGNISTYTFDQRDNLLTHTNPLGAVTSFTYDDQNNVTSGTDPLGRKTTTTYDIRGRPLSVTDARGFVSTSRYDAGGLLIGTTDALGNIRTFASDARGNPTDYTSAMGANTQNGYDSAGRRTTLTDALGSVLTYHYDANGNLLSQQGSGEPATTLQYDAESRVTGNARDGLQRLVGYDVAGRLDAVTTATNRQFALTSDPVGRLTSIVDPDDGPVLQMTYDAVGNLTRIASRSGSQITHAYDAADRLVESRRPDGSIASRAYDAAGQLVQSIDMRGNVSQRAYDAAGQLVRETDALGGQVLFEYDANGNQVSQIDPAGRTTTFAYDAINRLIRTTYADGLFELRGYDADGRLAQVTDPAGQTTTFGYDVQGRLLTVTDALGQVTQHGYEGSVQRSHTTDANGNTTRFAYDTSGRLISTTYPMGGVESTVYDVSGKPFLKTNAKGESVQYQYDARGRRSATLLPGGLAETYTYTADHLPATVTDSRGVTAFDYDPQTRRLLRVTEPDGRYVRYVYDTMGNKLLVAHGDAASEFVNEYVYDALNRIIRITDPSGGVTTQGWDSAGNLISVTRPNGINTQTAYNVLNRPISITHRDAANTLIAQETYTLDALGNRTGIDLHDGSHIEYRYDALSRVTGERRFDQIGTMTFDAVFAYDAVGNRIGAGPAASPTVSTYNADSQLVSGGGVTYSYDGAGRRTAETWTPAGGSPQSIQYAWDARDRMTGYRAASGALTTYAYDSEGVRVGKTEPAGSTRFLVDRDTVTGFSQIVRRTTPSSTDTFAWGAQMLGAIEAGTPRYPLFDALGSTRLLTGASGAVTDRSDYGAYGERLTASGASGLPHRYAGEETDSESGLTYLRARYYDPRSGRLLSRDAKPGYQDEPLSLNPYMYAAGNPVNRTDPSGNDFTIAGNLFANAQSLAIRGQEFINKRKSMLTADREALNTIRVFAGVMAIEAVIEDLGGSGSRVDRWFGGGNIASIMLGAFPEIGDGVSFGVHAVANGVMALTAYKLLNGETVFFDHEGVGILLSKDVTSAVEQLKKMSNLKPSPCARGDIAAANRETPPRIALCHKWWFMPTLPNSWVLTLTDYASKPGIMVHEFSHIAARTKDNAYNCGTGKLNRLKNIPGKALRNADSYRCWAEDSALGWGGSSLPKTWP